MFVRPEPHGDVQVFKTIEWFAVPPDGFLELTDHHFALTGPDSSWCYQESP